MNRCPVCGGNAGQFPPEGHYLCQELKKRNLPTPNLGERCPDCKGSKVKIHNIPVTVLLPIDPSGDEINHWFPPCSRCGGKGYLSEEVDSTA